MSDTTPQPQPHTADLDLDPLFTTTCTYPSSYPLTYPDTYTILPDTTLPDTYTTLPPTYPAIPPTYTPSLNLLHLLKTAATVSSGLVLDNGPGNPVESIPYKELLNGALQRARSFALCMALETSASKIVLLHVNNHRDSILYFWTILAAGGIPCISFELPQDLTARGKHILHLQSLLKWPIIITTEELLPEFCGLEGSNVLTTAAIETGPFNHPSSDVGPGFVKTADDTTVLMLATGGDGKAKAICLTSGQIVAAIKGKLEMHRTGKTDIFLAWSYFDHVSHLVEIHLHAVYLCAIQVLFPVDITIAKPSLLLEALERYHVSYTYIPNFFLKEMVAVLEKHDKLKESPFHPENKVYDFSNLKAVITQGTLGTETINNKAIELLSKHGAPAKFLRPGFGMTEFCGPANLIGKPINAVTIRIVDEDYYPVPFGESGMLEMSGPCVFTTYYNDPDRTTRMFTKDGWFRTGDLARIDDQGQIVLDGRYEERFTVRGKCFHPQDIEIAIRAQNIPGIDDEGIVVFSFCPKECVGAHWVNEVEKLKPENLVVMYETSFRHAFTQLSLDVEHRITGTVLEMCGIMPYKVLGVEGEMLPRTLKNRISNLLVKKAFLRGQLRKRSDGWHC
ncbi:putative Polyketide synthase PksJ [Glarea lozoyensis 74030]|uniref:Putative Polyketide synthase PksJ n=1 Tax=Glarea lozoyensis (strain ATCC 74030 / MF5533) TaxID=1104152 RepID=H0ECF2_GLAL7|nr:putative Polyketide synthase PksJ [Glarea lozoyensis 74030]